MHRREMIGWVEQLAALRVTPGVEEHVGRGRLGVVRCWTRVRARVRVRVRGG